MANLFAPSPSLAAWHELSETVALVAEKLPKNVDILNFERVCKLWKESRVPLPGIVQMQRLGTPQLVWLKRNMHRIQYYTLALGESAQATCDFEALLEQSLETFCAPPCLLKQLTIVQGAALHNTPRRWTMPNCLGRLTSLQKLHLNCCSMLAIPPDVLITLSALTDLELRSNYLECLPNFEQLGRLRRMAIQDCAKLVDIDNVGHLTALITLLVGSCGDLKRMPSLENLGSTLHCLEIVDCPTLDTWPNHVQKLAKLESLTLRDTNVEFPAGPQPVTSLTRLDVGNTGGVEPYWADAGRFPHLASLTVGGYGMDKLPENLGGAARLTELVLDNCFLHEPISWGFWSLRHLQRLIFRNSASVLPEHVSEKMPDTLTYLSIAGSPQLLMSAPVFEALRKLEHLSIEGCQSSAFHIPDTIRDCVALTHLHIRDCPVLDVLPVGIRNLASLVEFNITKCNNLRCLPAGFGSGNTSLRRVVLHDARCRRLPESLAAAISLQELELIGLKKLEYLPDLSHLHSLTSLTIKKCFSLQQWPDSLAVLLLTRQLQHLVLAETPFVNDVPPPEAIVGCLRHFHVRFCKPAQQPLPLAPLPLPQSVSTPLANPPSSPFKNSCMSPFGDAKPVDCSPEKYFARKLKLTEAANFPAQAAAQSGQPSMSPPSQNIEPGWPDSPFKQQAWDAADDPDRF